MDIQSNIEKFKSGELRWSIETSRVEKILPLIRRLAGMKYYSRTERNGRFTHFYTKAIPHWEIRDSDIRELRKIEKQFLKEELLREKAEIDNKLSALG